MALPFAKKAPSGSVGLDLDGDFVAAVQVCDGRVTRAASTELPPGVIAGGEVVDVNALGAALKDFFKDAGLPRTVRLGVANQQIVVRQLELPRIEDADDRAAAIRFQAAEAIAMPLDEAVLDHQEVGQSISPEGAARDRLIVVAAREAMISKLVASVRAAGLRPEGVDLNAFALVRALAGSQPDVEKARVFCHLGAVTNLAVAVGDVCAFTRVLPSAFAGAEATAPAPAPSEAPEHAEPAPLDASGPAPFDATPPTSEPAPFDAAPAPAPPADAEPPPFDATPASAERAPAPADPSQAVAALAEEIRLSIDFYMGQPEARWVGDVVLSGPGAARPGIAEELSPLVGVPVSVAQPFGELDAGEFDGEDPHRHTVAAGLALGALS